MIRFALLGSGSSGNALLIISSRAKVLIDNGLSVRELEKRLDSIGENLEGLRGIFVTHEHSDHVRGLGVLARKTKLPVFITPTTRDALPESVGEIPNVEYFESGESVTIDGLTLGSFCVSHDAADPVSYVAMADGVKLGLAADLGHVSQLVRTRLEGAQGLILESNYCPEMLLRGPYPPMLKQRIKGSHGHLSNADCNSLIADLLHDSLHLVVLAHISEENNEYEHAKEMAARVLHGHNVALYIAYQDKPTPVLTLNP